MSGKSLLRKLGGVFAVIVLLENEGAWGKLIVLKGTQEGLLKDGTVLFGIHGSGDPMKLSDTF